MKLDDIKNGWSQLRHSVAEGWQKLSESTSDALTVFQPAARNPLPSQQSVDDKNYSPMSGWGMIASNVFESDKSVVVRLEIPGLEKENTAVEVVGNTLIVSGEKRFEGEHSEGRYRVFQCAYGSFQRSVRLPVPVRADQAKADYRRGILEINLPKAQAARPRTIEVPVR